MNIAKSIKVGIALTDSTISDVRERVGKTAQTVSYWMNSKAEPKLKDVEKMADLFNVPVSTFIEWGESK